MRFASTCFVSLLFATALAAQSLPRHYITDLQSGPTTTTTLGRTVQLGDLDSDGVADYAVLVVFQFGIFDTNYRVLSGATGTPLFTINASGLTGPIRDAGDLTGDGVPDIIGLSYPGVPAPTQAVLFDGATGNTIWAVDVTPATVPQVGGAEPAVLSDLDGDGVSDIAILTYGISNSIGGGILEPTRVRWLSGATGTLLHEIIDADLIIRSIANAGDTNADGFDDLLVLAPFSPFVALNAGGASIVSGADYSYLRFFNGDAANDNFGTGGKGVGDVNNDGFDDYMISARVDDAVYLFSGADGTALETFPAGQSGLWFLLEDAPAFDWDGDGVDDHILSVGAGRQIRSGQDFSVLFESDSLLGVVADVNGDQLPEMALQVEKPSGYEVALDAHKGAQTYGVGSGGLALSWIPVSSSPGVGTFKLSGGTPSANAVIAGSLAPVNTIIFGTTFPLLVSPAPANLFLNFNTVLNGIGELSAPVSLTQPLVAGQVFYYQWAELSPNPGTSNGLQLLFDI